MNQHKWSRRVFGDHRDPREELAEVFGVAVPDSGDIQPEALDWARSQVEVGTMSQIDAIKALRDAEPRLGLKSATYLAQKVFADR